MKHRVHLSFIIDTDEYEEELVTRDQVGILVDHMIAGQADMPTVINKRNIEMDVSVGIDEE